MALVLSILPIALVILLGFLLLRWNVLPAAQWGGIEVLSFRVLIPAVLIRSIAEADLSFALYGPPIGAVLASLFLVAFLLLGLRALVPVSALPNPAFTTLFQATTRWNAFVALAAGAQFLGDAGMAVIAVAMAVLIPVINIGNVAVLTVFGSGRTTPAQALLAIAKNPLVIASLVGLGLNFSGIGLPGLARDTLDLVGNAALGVGLMSVGAGIDPRRLMRLGGALWLGVVLRLVLAPGLFVLIATLIGVSGEARLAGTFVLAVPSAMNGYIIAKQMGGDADLYADILSWQTLLSLIGLPLWVLVLAG